MKAEIITEWTGDGSEFDPNRPRVVDDYALKFTDTTAQPAPNLRPDPPIYIVQIECDEATLNAIKADGNYTVLWHE